MFLSYSGDARLAKSVKNKVHSFDLVSHDPSVIACDMSNVCERNSYLVSVLPCGCDSVEEKELKSNPNRLILTIL